MPIEKTARQQSASPNAASLDDPPSSQPFVLPPGYRELYLSQGQGASHQLSLPVAGPAPHSGEEARATAQAGLAAPSQPLPHRERIQQSFGPAHDLSRIDAHVGKAAAPAAHALSAHGYALGNHVAFAAEPSLALAAHEAAHSVEQQSGVGPGGVGARGDAHEVRADAVAAEVVAGRSAAHLLEPAGAVAGAPSLQLDEHPVENVGVFDATFTELKGVEVEGGQGKWGVDALIKFTPYGTAPDSTSIKMVQIVRFNEKVQNRYKPHVKNYFFIQALGEVRKNHWGAFGPDVDYNCGKALPELPSFKESFAPENTQRCSHGSKNGENIVPAVLFDPPGISNPGDGKHEYWFETSAVNTDNGQTYATIFWSFHFDKSQNEVVMGAVTVQPGSTTNYQTSLDNHKELLKTF